jgi:hypothetical protein
MTDENLILHFIRSMNALEQDHAPRYDVRGRGDNYSVWDTYLLQEVNDLEHTPHVAHYVRLADDLNAAEAAIQRDYDKQALDQLAGNN